MADMFARVDLMEGAANRTYRLVLERYPKNAKLLRSYGRFLENVKNDPGGAARYYAEAQKQARWFLACARCKGWDGMRCLHLCVAWRALKSCGQVPMGS